MFFSAEMNYLVRQQHYKELQREAACTDPDSKPSPIEQHSIAAHNGWLNCKPTGEVGLPRNER
jgi:hypothetical protein